MPKNKRAKPNSYAGSPWAVEAVPNMDLFGNSLLNSPMGPMMTPFVPGTSFASYTDLGDYGEIVDQSYMYNNQSSWNSGMSGYQNYNKRGKNFKRGGRTPRGMSYRGNRGMSPRGDRGKTFRGDRGAKGFRSVRGDPTTRGIRGTRGDPATRGIRGTRGDPATRGFRGTRGDRGIRRGGRGRLFYNNKRQFPYSNRGAGSKKKMNKNPTTPMEAEPYNPEEPTNEEEEELELSNDTDEEQTEMFGAKAPSQDQKLTKAARRKNWCTVCEAIFPGSFLVHRRSKEHRKQRDKKFPRCRLCRQSFKGMADFEKHNETEEHKKKSEDFQSLKEQQLMHAALSDSEDDGISLKKFIISQTDEKTVFRENDDPVGTRYVIPLKVYFCKLCQKLLKNHTSGYQVHCRTVDHIQKYKVYFEGKEERAAARRQVQLSKKYNKNTKHKQVSQEEVEYVEEEIIEEVEDVEEEEEEEQEYEGEEEHEYEGEAEELVEGEEFIEEEEELLENEEPLEVGEEIEKDDEQTDAVVSKLDEENGGVEDSQLALGTEDFEELGTDFLQNEEEQEIINLVENEAEGSPPPSDFN